ncbi:MAG: chaperonin GroEL [Cytophagales bacterium]
MSASTTSEIYPRVLKGQAAREKMLEASKNMSGTVGATLGPKGRNGLLDKKFGDPVITKDGVSAAEVITHEDPFINMGLRFFAQGASKANKEVGDGTTTTTVLSTTIFQEGVKSEAAGASPIDLKRGIDKGLKIVQKSLHEQGKQIKTHDEIVKIATIAANGDKEIGNLIADAVAAVGKDGVITVGESKSMVSELNVATGMQFDKGYLSPYFVTDRKKMATKHERPLILICKNKISSLKEITPALELVYKEGAPLLIIAQDIEGEGLATLVLNRLRGSFQVAAVKAPGFGNHRDALLEDIAIMTGGRVIDNASAEYTLDNIKLEYFGKAKMTTVKKDETVIIEGAGNKAAIEERIAEIKQSMADASDYEREKLQERVAKMGGGVAEIKVGAPTEAELKEKKDRTDDALNATRAALEKGIVSGGGVALLRTRKSLEKFMQTLENQDQITGAKILHIALGAPLRRIAANAGAEPSVVLSKVEAGTADFGYNAAKDEFCQMETEGIIDPLKVVLAEIQTAVSIAGTAMTMEFMVREPKEEKGVGMPAGGMGGGMM